MWFPISGERRVHVVPCAQTGGGVKGQSDLGFSWGCGKLPGVGTAQRPGGGRVCNRRNKVQKMEKNIRRRGEAARPAWIPRPAAPEPSSPSILAAAVH